HRDADPRQRAVRKEEMRVTSKGQVTIPQQIREKFDFLPERHQDRKRELTENDGVEPSPADHFAETMFAAPPVRPQAARGPCRPSARRWPAGPAPARRPAKQPASRRRYIAPDEP